MKNEEKCLKRFLKRRLSFSLDNLVKFLITGTLAFTVTACGGGGGGSSTSVRKDTATNVSKVNENNKKDKPAIDNKIEIQNISNEIEKLTEEFDNGEKDNYESFSKNLNEFKEKVDKLEVKDVKTKEDIDNLLKSFDKLVKAKKGFNNFINDLDEEAIKENKKRIEKTENNIDTIGEKIEDLIAAENPNFTKIQNIDNHLEGLEVLYEVLDDDYIEVLNVFQKEVNTIKVEDIKTDEDKEVLNELISKIEKDKNILNEEIDELTDEEKAENKELIDKINEKISAIENKLKELKKEVLKKSIKSFNLRTDAIQYSAETLPVEEPKFEDLVSPYLKETAKVWDALRKDEDAPQEIKDIIKILEKDNYKNIEEKMKDLYPSMYSNLAREISSKNKFFNSKDKEAINNLNGNQFGFILLNEYKDIKNHNHITGYKTRQNGFVGTLDLGNNLYGNLGYAYDDIKYKENGKSTIQTIHLGLNKSKKLENYEDVNLEFNLSGDYNFHKNTREMKNFDKTAEAKFNSYSIGTSAKISKKFGDELYIKPFSKIELAYMKHKGFTEKKAGLINTRIKEQNYTSFLPQVGFELGKSFYNFNLFANLTYGYELGNLNKAEEFSYEFEKDASRKLVKDDLEKSRVSAQVGANYKTDSFYVGVNIGQDFDKRSNKFMSFTLGYKF